MEETEREEIFHGQGSVSKVIFRSDEAAVPALGAVAAGGGPAACGAGRLYRGPGGPVLRGAAAGRFDGEIYLNTYRTGLEPKTAYLFSAFRKERIWHVLGGMAWMYLWIFLWSLIPVVGIVFGVIRAYEYRFTPYILMTRDDVKPTEAIKVSKAETMGYKGKMFGADMLATGAWIVGIAVLSLLGAIPYLGVLFKIVRFVFNLAYSLLAPLFFGILSAAFYVEIQNRRAAAPQQPSAPVPPVIPVHTPETQPAQPAAPVVTEPAPEEAPETTEPAPESPEAPQAPAAETNANTCPHCGAAVTAEGARFCTACGGRLDG